VKSLSQGKVAIVTGASAGIGCEIAAKLAEDGFHVVLAARRCERLLSLERDIQLKGGSGLAVTTDITQPQDRRRLVDNTLSAFGRIDVLVNNAGSGLKAPLEVTPLELIRANFEINLFGHIALSQLIIPIMRSQRSGHIINMSSLAGRIARPYSAVYDASKHALEAISDSWRKELASFGIRVIVIEPGFIKTEFHEVANRESELLSNQTLVYDQLMEKQAKRDERIRRLAGQPKLIANLVSSVLKKPNPRPRYAAPSFARVALCLKRTLPERLFDRLFA
jgi:NAD(P)-dependent dehydrogenase (short-subunit alcohol dehydrogenase family)